MLSIKELDTLIDELKIIARISKIVLTENDYEKRKFAHLIFEDAMNHLINDLVEMKEK